MNMDMYLKKNIIIYALQSKKIWKYGRMIVSHLIIFTNEFTVRRDVMMNKVTFNIEYIADANESTMDGWRIIFEYGNWINGTCSHRNEEDKALAEEIDTTDKFG